MSSHPIPLNQLATEIQNAVEQILGKHGAVPVDKLWVGFVAPDNIANIENADKLAAQLAKGSGVQAQGSVAQLAASAGGQADTQEAGPQVPGRPRIIGLVYSPRA